MLLRINQARVKLRGKCIIIACGAALLVGGCQTPPLQQARREFYRGNLAQAEEQIKDIPADDKDEVLLLMERGMIRHALQHYDDSAADWRRAADRSTWLETYSLTHGAASLISNDRALPFRGTPFEITLLYAFLAKNYLAEQNWDYAAISARNIIKRLENLDGFPDMPYARYMAGFCLSLINDDGNAAIQYRAANQNLDGLQIIPETGAITDNTNAVDSASTPRPDHELVVFVAVGSIPTGIANDDDFRPPGNICAEIYAGAQMLGYAYVLDDTAALLKATQARLAAIQAVKDAARIATKTAIAASLEHQNEPLGDLVRFILFAMEAPDTRRWETLPRWLGVARVPCPADLASYRVVFPYGYPVKAKEISQPLVRRGRLLISFCRDL